jgi:hypothetical protein
MSRENTPFLLAKSEKLTASPRSFHTPKFVSKRFEDRLHTSKFVLQGFSICHSPA